MEWFHQNQIQAGDPLTIQDNYFRENKSKVALIMQEQGNQNKKESVL